MKCLKSKIAGMKIIMYASKIIINNTNLGELRFSYCQGKARQIVAGCTGPAENRYQRILPISNVTGFYHNE
jgi:hypothetical protein